MNVAISNSLTTSSARRLTAALLSACAVAVLAATASVAKAADVTAPSRIVVKYRDLDLRTERGTLALYHRIESAAHKVCPDTDSRLLEQKAAVWSCRRQAMDRAVESVSSPQLASLLKSPRLAYMH
jgi:UrcA family protein